MQVVRDSAGLERMCRDIQDSPVIALDLETTGLDALTDRIRLVSVSTGKDVYVADVYALQDSVGRLAGLVREYAGLLVGHNLKFDIKFLIQAGADPRNCRVFDTFRASQVLCNGRDGESHDLISTLERAGLSYDSEDLGGSDWSGVLTQKQYEYAGEDVRQLHKLMEWFRIELSENGLGPATKLDCDVIRAEAHMELAGMALDKTMWLELASNNRTEADRVQQSLLEELPAPNGQCSLFGGEYVAGFNLNSRLKVMKSFERLGVDLPDTRSQTLILQSGDHPLLEKFGRYRKYSKSVSSFGEEYLKHLHPVTGRVHSSYWPFTGAGRYSCSSPNLQQIPRSKEFRECFRAPEGQSLVVCDYSQIELRIMAELSRDETLRTVFRQGIDAHTQTAAIISASSLANVTKDARQKAKPVNFGLMYGMGAQRLAMYSKTEYGVDMTLEEASTFRDRYFQAYRGVKRWHQQTVGRGVSSGQSRTQSGRRRFLPKESYSEFLNTPVQGTGADGMKRAMANLFRALPEGSPVKLVNVVHDEMVIQCPTGMAEEVSVLVSKCMKDGMTPYVTSVPVVAESSIGESWADK
jgi:DNA polymerase I